MGKKQVNIRVSKEQYERWDTHVKDNPDLQSGMSGLIRTAVEDYISDGEADLEVEVSVPDEIRERLIEVDERTEDMERVLDRVDESVGFIERDVADVGGESFSDELMRAVPPKRPETERWEGAREEFADEPIAWEGTIDSFVETLDGERAAIENAIESAAMMQDSPIVVAGIGGQRRYYSPREYHQQPYADKRQSKKRVQERRLQERQGDRDL
jgi:predicted DNA-binding protein